MARRSDASTSFDLASLEAAAAAAAAVIRQEPWHEPGAWCQTGNRLVQVAAGTSTVSFAVLLQQDTAWDSGWSRGPAAASWHKQPCTFRQPHLYFCTLKHTVSVPNFS